MTALDRTTAIRQVQDSTANQELKDRTSDFLFGCLFLCRTKVEGTVSVNSDGTEIVLDWHNGSKQLRFTTDHYWVAVTSFDVATSEGCIPVKETFILWEEVRALDPRLEGIWEWLTPSMTYDLK